MSRINTLVKMEAVGNLDLEPHQAVGNFLESQMQENFYVKPPNWDTQFESIEMLAIANTRENEAMHLFLKDMWRNKVHEEVLNQQRVREMRKMQEHLRRHFIKVNNFIKDCKDKKRIADTVLSTEVNLHFTLRNSIKTFRDSLQNLRIFQSDLKDTMVDYKSYEQVLENVVAKSSLYSSIKDCTDRCDALMLGQQQIQQLENKKIKEIEEMRKHFVTITQEAALTVLGVKNDLAKLERSYNLARNKCHKWEQILSASKDAVTASHVNSNRAYDGINHLIALLCKRKGHIPSLRVQTMTAKLDFIKSEIELLSDVVKEIQDGKAILPTTISEHPVALC